MDECLEFVRPVAAGRVACPAGAAGVAFVRLHGEKACRPASIAQFPLFCFSPTFRWPAPLSRKPPGAATVSRETALLRHRPRCRRRSPTAPAIRPAATVLPIRAAGRDVPAAAWLRMPGRATADRRPCRPGRRRGCRRCSPSSTAIATDRSAGKRPGVRPIPPPASARWTPTATAGFRSPSGRPPRRGGAAGSAAGQAEVAVRGGSIPALFVGRAGVGAFCHRLPAFLRPGGGACITVRTYSSSALCPCGAPAELFPLSGGKWRDRGERRAGCG